MNSCIYQGKVTHARKRPIPHKFQYRMFMIYIDLDELEERLFQRFWFCSLNRFNLASLYRKDHFGDPEQNWSEVVRQKIREHTGAEVDGKICLLTQLRHFGFGFNPVSFYYCYDQADQLQFVIAEVNNTPWGEQHLYILEPDLNAAGWLQAECAKAFHVSPFMGMDFEYEFQLSEPADQLKVQIHNRETETTSRRKAFTAAIAMKRYPLTRLRLASTLARFPLSSFRIVTAIYWQAFRLWLKGVKFVPHPGKSLEPRTPRVTLNTPSPLRGMPKRKREARPA